MKGYSNYSPPWESKTDGNFGEGLGPKKITFIYILFYFLFNSFFKKVFTYSPYLVQSIVAVSSNSICKVFTNYSPNPSPFAFFRIEMIKSLTHVRK